MWSRNKIYSIQSTEKRNESNNNILNLSHMYCMPFHARILRWRFFLCRHYYWKFRTLNAHFRKWAEARKKLKRRDDFFIWTIIILSINGVDLLRAVRMLFHFFFDRLRVSAENERESIKNRLSIGKKCFFSSENVVVMGRIEVDTERTWARGKVKKKPQHSVNKTYEFERRDASHWKGKLTIAFSVILNLADVHNNRSGIQIPFRFAHFIWGFISISMREVSRKSHFIRFLPICSYLLIVISLWETHEWDVFMLQHRIGTALRLH